MTGYELMTDAQRAEMDDLTERAQHQDTMRFTALDAATLEEYKALAERLEAEYRKDAKTRQH